MEFCMHLCARRWVNNAIWRFIGKLLNLHASFIGRDDINIAFGNSTPCLCLSLCIPVCVCARVSLK